MDGTAVRDELKRDILRKHTVIAISGKSGCGNTTVTRLVAETLDLDMINYTFRNLADEEGVPLDEILERAKNDPELDRRLDAKQIELAREASCVLGSRLAIWNYPGADLSVYLFADVDTRARRIHRREGGMIEDVLAATKLRDENDQRRYREIYGIDTNDYRFADLVVDTVRYDPEQITELIVQKLAASRGLTRGDI